MKPVSEWISRFFLLAGLLITLSAGAVQWPIKGIKDSDISSHFGENRTDHFHSGVDIARIRDEVYPVEKGEMIYYWSNEDSFYPEEFGMGKTVVLEHGHFRSYYSHLEKIFFPKGSLLDETTHIGNVGNTGRSTGYHLHLSIKKDQQFLNPTLLLPQIDENQVPVVKSIFFRAGYYQKEVGGKTSGKIVLPMRASAYRILVRTYDPVEGKYWKRMIRSLKAIISDSENRKVFYREIFFHFLQNGKMGGKHRMEDIFDFIRNEEFIVVGDWKKKRRKDIYTLKLEITDNSENRLVLEKQIYFR